MSERLKKLRKALDLTQQEFADRLGIKRNTVAQYEIGRNEPIDAVIISICREFDVNEEWLRTGKGDMFLPLDRNADIARLTKLLLNEESDSFKNRFISMLANLSVRNGNFWSVKRWNLQKRSRTKLSLSPVLPEEFLKGDGCNQGIFCCSSSPPF